MCSKSVLALSSCGHVYEKENKINLSFKPVPDLKGKEFVRLSGIDNCVFVINAKGRVFVRGSNDFCRLSLKDSVNYFTEILSLRNYKIVDVFLSPSHSFFKADNGQILVCGSNTWGELLTENGLRGTCIYNPTKTIIIDVSLS